MPELLKIPSQSNFQKYVMELEREREFASQSTIDKCMLLAKKWVNFLKQFANRKAFR